MTSGLEVTANDVTHITFGAISRSQWIKVTADSTAPTSTNGALPAYPGWVAANIALADLAPDLGATGKRVFVRSMGGDRQIAVPHA